MSIYRTKYSIFDGVHFVKLPQAEMTPDFCAHCVFAVGCVRNLTPVCVCLAGYYTCVEVIFTLRRQVGFYMMGVYAPTLLIVVLSWLSFWINPDASAARVPLGTVSLLGGQERACVFIEVTT